MTFFFTEITIFFTVKFENPHVSNQYHVNSPKSSLPELGLEILVVYGWDRRGRSIDQGTFKLGTSSLVIYNVKNLRQAGNTCQTEQPKRYPSTVMVIHSAEIIGNFVAMGSLPLPCNGQKSLKNTTSSGTLPLETRRRHSQTATVGRSIEKTVDIHHKFIFGIREICDILTTIQTSNIVRTVK